MPLNVRFGDDANVGGNRTQLPPIIRMRIDKRCKNTGATTHYQPKSDGK